ncbi:MAG TPA: hypothetical protein VK059_00920 [Nocardioidaceae bacterium]|nr:hypothetical protein [Nocardioidaceae bacterium]
MNSATRRLTAAVSGGLLATAIMTGCGDDGDDNDSGSDSNAGGDYCSQVEDMKGEFEAFSDPDYTLGDIAETIGILDGIAQSAPDDITPSWEALHSSMSDIESKLSDFGVKEDEPLQSELERIAKDDQSKQKEIVDVLSGTQDVQSDANKIEKQVNKECDIDLSSDSDGGSGDSGDDSGDSGDSGDDSGDGGDSAG